ncbi:hypothetical protein KIL84_000427 [Mauremys mutica]|uniref:Uncharacterized protein n=1 Tax=Mauremys mutica TaxID=74926 RepID=A0A9D3XG83_9SAUR|nr:hypothetical protein KIL84_000427 [Mauremys mutica]
MQFTVFILKELIRDFQGSCRGHRNVLTIDPNGFLMGGSVHKWTRPRFDPAGSFRRNEVVTTAAEAGSFPIRPQQTTPIKAARGGRSSQKAPLQLNPAHRPQQDPPPSHHGKGNWACLRASPAGFVLLPEPGSEGSWRTEQVLLQVPDKQDQERQHRWLVPHQPRVLPPRRGIQDSNGQRDLCQP